MLSIYRLYQPASSFKAVEKTFKSDPPFNPALMFADMDENDEIESSLLKKLPSDLPKKISQAYSNTAITVADSEMDDEGLDLKEHLAGLEVQLIKQALGKTNGVVAHAAKLLKMRRTTLVEKLKKYDIKS